MLYYDGQFHDARMALSLALTAQQYGATIANHVAVTGLLKEAGKICGAQLTDSLTGETWPLAARGVAVPGRADGRRGPPEPQRHL